MIPQTRLLLGLLSYNAFTSLTLAASPTSFCKCTCFSNSTIIPLDAPSPATQRPQQLFVARHAENDELEEPLPEDPPSNTGLPVAAPGENGGGRIWDEKGDDEDRVEFRRGNCNDCNRQYCDELHLPICTGANLEDIFTTCFQRDSRKDEAVVFIFIFATAGLLIWAVVKPWVGKWLQSARERSSYIPVSSRGDS